MHCLASLFSCLQINHGCNGSASSAVRKNQKVSRSGREKLQPALLIHTEHKEPWALHPDETSPRNSYQQVQHHSGLYAMVWRFFLGCFNIFQLAISVTLTLMIQCKQVSRLLKLHMDFSVFLDHACIFLTVLKAKKDHQNRDCQWTTGIYNRKRKSVLTVCRNQTSKGQHTHQVLFSLAICLVPIFTNFHLYLLWTTHSCGCFWRRHLNKHIWQWIRKTLSMWILKKFN